MKEYNKMFRQQWQFDAQMFLQFGVVDSILPAIFTDSSIFLIRKDYIDQWRIRDYPDGEAPTLEFGPKDFDRKLHWNESNWTEGRGVPTTNLDPPM